MRILRREAILHHQRERNRSAPRRQDESGRNEGGYSSCHTNAGTYNGDAWSFQDASGNYKSASGTVNDSIGQASASITVTPYSVTYDGNSHTATGTGVGGVNLSSDLTLSGTTHTNAGTYNGDAWSFQDASGNYKSASGTVNDSIAKATLTVTTDSKTKAFGTVFTAFTGSVNGLMGGDNITIGSFASAGAPAAAPPGSYPITATLSDPGNKLGNYTITYVNGTLTVNQSIIVLDPSAGGALSLAGNASINFSGVVYVDSNSSSALSASGNAQVKATAIDVHGGVKKSGNASLSPTPVTGAAVIADPLVSLPSPSTTGMTNYGSFSLSGNSSQTIQPGIYNQISVSGNAKLTMSSGIYIIEGCGFSASGNASVTGSGVMIFNAGSKYPSTGGTCGSITLGGNATDYLSPATSGPYAGIVFFQPLDNTQALTVTANASGITGTIYAPGAQLSESGNAALNASLIVDTLTISGNGVADSLPLAATSGVVALTVTTPDLSTPSAPAASPTPSSSSTALTALDLALDDLSTTATGTASWVNNVSDAPSTDLTRVVLASPFAKQKRV